MTEIKEVSEFVKSWDIAVCLFAFNKEYPDLTVSTPEQFYNYRLPRKLEAEIGDIAIVYSQTGVGLVKICDIIPNTIAEANEANKATAYVIDTVDLTDHFDRVEKAERITYLKNVFTDKKKQFEEVQMLEMIAKGDEEFGKLLTEYKELRNDD